MCITYIHFLVIDLFRINGSWVHGFHNFKTHFSRVKYNTFIGIRYQPLDSAKKAHEPITTPCKYHTRSDYSVQGRGE